MPMLTTVRIALAGDAGPRAGAHLLGEGVDPLAAPRARQRRRPGRRPRARPSSGRAQRGVQHRPVLGDVDVLAGEHRVAPLGQPDLVGQGEQGGEDRRSSTRFLDRSTCRSAAVKRQPLDPPGIVGEPARRSGAKPRRARRAVPRRRWRSASTGSRGHVGLPRLGSPPAGPARSRAARSTTSTNFSTPSALEDRDDVVVVDAGAGQRRHHLLGVVVVRPTWSPWTSPWSAKASRVFSGIVLTVFSTTRSSTYIVSR